MTSPALNNRADLGRYRPTDDGKIAFVGRELVLTMELDAAITYRDALVDLGNGEDRPALATEYSQWADELTAAIERIKPPFDMAFTPEPERPWS